MKYIHMGCPDSVMSSNRASATTETSKQVFVSDKDKKPYKEHLCLLCALTMYLHGHSKLDAHTSQLFTEFISRAGYDPKNFLGVAIDDLPLVEELVERNIFSYDFDIQEWEYVRELVRRSIGKYEKPWSCWDSTTISFIRIILIPPSSVFDVLAVTVSSTDQTTSSDIF